LFQKGYLADLTNLPGMENFGDVAKSAWITDDGKSVFCVPMASVIHGFIYNKDIFNELGLTEPKTEAEFYAVLDKIKADGRYAPLVMGTKDQWESATMGYQNIGPNYWKGEEGRLGLIAGTAKYNEGGFLQAFEALAKWTPYLPDGYQAVSYPDAQNLFILGKGAIYPAGSWDISVFKSQVDFEIGAFKPPLPEGADKCYISDHTDIAIGMNAATKNPDAAKTFLSWVASAEFANLYSNALPGFFSLSNAAVTLEDPIAQTFLDWRKECSSTIRSAYQILSRGEPNNENDLALRNNFVFFLIHMFVQNPIGLFLAALLSSRFVRGRAIYRTLIFTPTILSVVLVGFIWQLILSPLWGIADSLLRPFGLKTLPYLGLETHALPVLSLVSVWQWVGLPMMLFLAALISIPDELIEAARVDGATGWGVFMRIKLPLILPTVGIVAVLTFVGNFNAFDLIYTTQKALAGPNFSTDILGTFFYRTFFGVQLQLGNPTMGATVAAMMLLIILGGVLFYLFAFQRRLLRLEVQL
jgi:ABC-type sugar transport system permease subunit